MPEPLTDEQLATLESATGALYAAHAGIPLLVAEVRALRARALDVATRAAAEHSAHRRGCAACRSFEACADGARLRAIVDVTNREVECVDDHV